MKYVYLAVIVYDLTTGVKGNSDVSCLMKGKRPGRGTGLMPQTRSDSVEPPVAKISPSSAPRGTRGLRKIFLVKPFEFCGCGGKL